MSDFEIMFSDIKATELGAAVVKCAPRILDRYFKSKKGKRLALEHVVASNGGFPLLLDFDDI